MSHLNPSHSKRRTRQPHGGCFDGVVFLLVGALLFGAAGAVGAQEPGEEKTIVFEGDVLRPGDTSLSDRIATAENKIDLYLDQSRTSAKEGLESAFKQFAEWFRDYNERQEPPGVQAIRKLLFGVVDVVSLGLPVSASSVMSFGSNLVQDMSRQLPDAGTTRFEDTDEFLTRLRRAYDKWILTQGLDVYRAFHDDSLFAAAVDIYTEDFERFSLASGSVRDNGPLRQMMENLGVSAPGRETRRHYNECGLFLLVKHTVLTHHEHIGLTGGETPWDFLGLDLDNYVRLEQIGPRNYVHWKPNDYDICPDAEAL